MNSCLADLSRLIPQQYMRKGRGRVEKTEIIEMAIRHLKNLQNQECIRESSCTEQYRLGYNDCLTEAAKFMLRERGEEMCYRMAAHLKDHCNELMKGEIMKSRCASEVPNGGSPAYLHHGPLSQLRDMLSCPSDIEQSSNDHHDIKDLSCRSSGNSSNPPQAAVITSTAPISVQHLDTSSNHSTMDYEGSSPSRISNGSTNGQLHHIPQDTNNNINAQHESVLRTIRMRKFSENSPEHDHSHNSYKFKNYIQQRFSHENGNENGHISEVAHSPSSLHEDHSLADLPQPSGVLVKPLTNGLSSKGSLMNGTDEPLSLKRKVACIDQQQNSPPHHRGDPDLSDLDPKQHTKNALTEIKTEHGAPLKSAFASYMVPIFACHTQGFYIPLNVSYEMLLPYLNGIDLFCKAAYRQMPPLHPISISVNYAPIGLVKAAVNGMNTVPGKVNLVDTMVGGC
ncbi:transcription factor cwo [Uranotaenia lowii]|uniref:transcription factor cwo n=1 Tax=Uranotaenia lowii TaxID=190385 RepID=UPI002478DEEF|nr:transcription factor cwo [Uranotaenia lowii]